MTEEQGTPVDPVDADREDGLPRVVDVDAEANVRDAFHNSVRVRWTVTIKCTCEAEVEASSLTAIVACDECGEEWEAASALSG
jgi:hypothetical protein